MTDAVFKQAFKEVQKESWEFYRKWRNEETYSPALKCTVKVSLLGWNHLIGKTGNKKRKIQDAYRRLKLIPYAKQIIKDSTTIQNIIVRKGRTYYALEAMTLVTEKDTQEYRKIRVIIVESKVKEKIFFSVMDKKNRVRKESVDIKNEVPHASGI